MTNFQSREQAEAEREQNVHPSNWVNPEGQGRYNLVVLGGGAAGLMAARIANGLGARVALIERELLGGDCLNVGCVPTKALIRTARSYADMPRARHYGAAEPKAIETDYDRTMTRLRGIQARISRGDAAALLQSEGIDVFFGDADFSGPDTIRVLDQHLEFRRAVIATGGHQRSPEVPGLDEVGYLDVARLLDLPQLPRRLMVIGGGPLGTELAQAYCRLGSKVFLVHDHPSFLPREERDAAQLLSDALARDGVEIYLNWRVVSVRRAEGFSEEKAVDLMSHHKRMTLAVDHILAGIGRVPTVAGLGLEEAGIEYDSETGIVVDDYLRTTNHRVFAAGDVCMPHKFTHVADASARIAVQNALFFRHKRASRLTIPWCTYTDPEIAHVGMYVADANRLNIPTRTYTVLMHQVDRAIADGEAKGFVKIHVRGRSDEILGATIVARHAGEMINEITLAMQQKIGLSALADVIHAYPTQAEAIKRAADACKASKLTPWIRTAIQRWLRYQLRPSRTRHLARFPKAPSLGP